MNDIIYRQQAINAMCDACSDWCDEGVCKKVSAIQKLSSAEPDVSTCWGCNCPKMDLLKQSTQHNTDSTHRSVLDCVRKQQVIDAVNAATVNTNPEHFKGYEKFTSFIEDEDISSYGKWERANGFNIALVEIRVLLGKLSCAEPERMCYGCMYEGHGSVVCDSCSRFFLDRYEADNNG